MPSCASICCPTDRLENATISQSAGNASLDREALRVARESEYSPAVEKCRAVPCSCLYTVSFDPVL
jgi:TonB family protein